MGVESVAFFLVMQDVGRICLGSVPSTTGSKSNAKHSETKMRAGKYSSAHQLPLELPLQTGCFNLRPLHVCPAFHGVIAVHLGL